MLWSVYYEWEWYMPLEERIFAPQEGLWMAWSVPSTVQGSASLMISACRWMQWQIFIPILLLQIVNLLSVARI